MDRTILVAVIGIILLIGGISGIIYRMNNPKFQEKDDNDLLLPFAMAVVGFLTFGMI